jgi:hypothetical protein
MPEPKVINLLTRVFAFPSGVLFIWYGITTLITPVTDETIGLVNSICAIMSGLYLVFYGITGHGNIRKNNN